LDNIHGEINLQFLLAQHIQMTEGFHQPIKNIPAKTVAVNIRTTAVATRPNRQSSKRFSACRLGLCFV
jgi:hypothetical protein